MGKIINSTFDTRGYTMFSQTPKNFSEDNYYLASLQDKVDADWEYRPNRVDVEQEMVKGSNEYSALEVVIQSVKSDTGEKVSDDIKRLVYRNISYKVPLGTKFRFSYSFNLNEDDKEKNVWLVTNKDETTPTAQSVVSRCNNTIGSVYTDEQGNKSYHYEEVVCANKLSSTAFNYNSFVVTPNASLIIVAQHNKYTKQYYVNQRFVIGYDAIYKVMAIDKYNSLKTYDPTDVDLVMLYVGIDEKAPNDDFENRIAFNNAGDIINNNPVVEPTPVPTPASADAESKAAEEEESKSSTVSEKYSIRVTKPKSLPTELLKDQIIFETYIYRGRNRMEGKVNVEINLPDVENIEEYVEFIVSGDNSFTLSRKKFYNIDPLTVKLTAVAENGANLSKKFELSLEG